MATRKTLGEISQELAEIYFSGAHVPTSTLSALRARGVNIADPDQLLDEFYHSPRKPLWFDAALQARLAYWRACRAMMGEEAWTWFISSEQGDPIPEELPLCRK